MEKGAHVRFAQPRELRDEAVADGRPVLECNQFAFSLREVRRELGEPRQIRTALGLPLGRVIVGDIVCCIDRQMVTARRRIIDADVLCDLEQPRREGLLPRGPR